MTTSTSAVEAERQLAGADRDQVAMMEERVIVTDYYDVPIGSGSKKDTHIWSNIQAGMLHRAFSVFLFTPEGKLVLQQRAGTKITFPHIWANTCCSHPLDVPAEREVVDAMGVKNAARRKLEHELGIPPEDVPLDCFTWLTRVHYVGASVPSDGSEPVWGEHEVDWILMCTPPTMPRMKLNPNEVAQVKAFSQSELKEWMATRSSHGNQVSPWFGVMEASLLYRWWDAVLTKTLDRVVDRATIHRQHELEAMAAGSTTPFPLPPAFAACLAASTPVSTSPRRGAGAGAGSGAPPGGGGSATMAGPKVISGGAGAGATTAAVAPPASEAEAAAVIPGSTAVVSKQGAYGKVKIHSEGKLSQLSHLDEVWEMVLFKLGASPATQAPPLPPTATPARVFCEQMLAKVSRSFALVIMQLPDHLRVSICIFYLVLRGLDTVEDDMVAFEGRQAEKLHHLRNFHNYLRDPGFGIEGVGEGDEAALLQSFRHVNEVFATLLPVEQEVIADICARMGEGMAAFAGRDLRQGTRDVSDYNLYCHYVAGLVGEGLSRLFVAHGDEDPIVAKDVRMANDMGLFLQKTNIIRDYLEDLVEGRAFWPQSIWSQYSSTLGDLRSKVDALVHPPPPGATTHDRDAVYQEDQARACLNHLVADALTLAPSCLRYMERLRTPGVFRFCSIPQLMAIATLEKLANNADVFTGVVKLRKGLALKLLARAVSMTEIYATFLRSARAILRAIPPHHKAAYELAARATAEVESIVLPKLPPSYVARAMSPFFSSTAVFTVMAVFVMLLRFLYLRSKTGEWGGTGYMPRITNSWDVAAVSGAVACAAYILACAGIPIVLGLTNPATTASSPRASSPTNLHAKVGAMSHDAPLATVASGAAPATVPRRRAART